jgi:hypothetical protein
MSIKNLEWHRAPWKGKWDKKTGYTIFMHGKIFIANFCTEDEMNRVVKLWNATKHLSEKDLDELCKNLLGDLARSWKSL